MLMNSQLNAYNPIALALFDRSATEVPIIQKNKVDTAITTLIETGVWDKLDAFILSPRWQDEQAGLLDWKRPVSFTKNGSASWSSTLGLVGASSAGAYFNSVFTPTTDAVNYTANSAGIGCYISEMPTVAARSLFGGYGSQGTYKRINLQIYQSPNANSFSNSVINGYDGTGAERVDNTAANSATTGLVQFNRTSSALSGLFMNGTSVASVNNNNGTRIIQDVPIYVLANNTNGSIGAHSDAKLYAWWAGAPLDVTEQAALKSIIDAYMA